MADLQIPGIELEFAFAVEIIFAERIDFIGPRRGKGYVPPASGTISGPLLNGRVVPYSGADYAIFTDLAEGIKVNTHYMMQADDGTWIYINNRGFLHRSPDPANPGRRACISALRHSSKHHSVRMNGCHGPCSSALASA